MLADVSAALRGSSVDTVVVAASDEIGAGTATALGLDVVIDPQGTESLDQAVSAAADRLRAVGSLLVVMADLPRLTVTDVEEVLGADAEVVVAPTADGGTGALLRTPPDAIPSAYGPQSARRHRALAASAGRSFAAVRADGFSHDVDTLVDLEHLREGPVGPATSHVLEELLAELSG